MKFWQVVLIALLLHSCRTLSRKESAPVESSNLNISIVVPAKSAFPPGSPTEKISRMEVFVQYSEADSFCKAMGHFSETFPITELPANFRLQTIPLCSALVHADLVAGDERVFATSFAVNPSELKGEKTYRPNTNFVTTTSGIFADFGAKIDLAGAPEFRDIRNQIWEDKITEFDVIFEPEVRASLDISAFMLSKDLIFDPVIVGNIWGGKARFFKNHEKLKSVYVSCDIQVDAEFSSAELPSFIQNMKSRWILVDLPSGVEEVTITPAWSFTDLHMKLLKTIVPKSAKIENFRCVALDDPRDPNHRIRPQLRNSGTKSQMDR